MKAKNKRAKELPSGCLAIFGLPFFIAGLFVTVWYFGGYIHWFDAKSWIETPCWIESADLKVNSDSDGSTYRATATYRYQYQGKTYRSTRVTFDDSNDNIGDFHQRMHHELSSHVRAAKDVNAKPSFQCYVNPEKPDEAVLYRELRWEMQAFKSIFALTFPAVGAGLVFGGLISSRKKKKESARQRDNPNQPWKWKLSWAEKSIPEKHRSWRIALYLYTLWSAAIIWPLIIILASTDIYTQQPMSWLTLILVALWLIPAWYSLRHWRHQKTIGPAQFEPKHLPCIPGTPLHGAILIKHKPTSRQPIDLTLICEKQITTNSGNESSTSKELYWEQHASISPDYIIREISSFRIPVQIDIPHDAPESGPDPNDSTTEYIWELRFKMPSSPVQRCFELPVFHSSESALRRHTETTSASPGILDNALGNLPQSLADCGIRSSFHSNGPPSSIICPPARHLTSVILLILFNLIWTGAAIFLIKTEAPLLFQIVWGVSSVAIWLWGVWLILHQRSVQLSPSSIEIKNNLGPVTWDKSFRMTDIQSFYAKESYQSGNTHYYKVKLKTTSNQSCTLADRIPSSTTAEALARSLDAWLPNQSPRNTAV